MQQIVHLRKGPPRTPRLVALRLLLRIERLFDGIFGTDENPWNNLGALSYYFFWIIAATGLYLYAVFDTSVVGVYASMDAITAQWYFGGVIRSLHRYASDAFAVTMTLHLIREYLKGRYSGFRWFSWVSGVPLLWLAFTSGINGYWLVWDRLAQFVAIGTAELLDWLPVFGGTMVRNFLTPESISDRFFSLLVFLHIGLPLLLLAGMWIHIQRITRARIKPTRRFGTMTFAMMVILSLIKPAVSMPPADIAATTPTLPLDWFYLAVYPLMYAWSPGAIWALLLGATTLLLILPFTVRNRQPKAERVAVVDLANCNGCGRCFNDCPYSAITMQSRSDGAHHALEAVVNPDLCASCGICAGACPSSTPFRSIQELVTGIDMPQRSIQALRVELDAALKKFSNDNDNGIGIVVFGCSCSAPMKRLNGDGVAVIELLCAGQLPPSFVEYALRNGADGVLVAGCPNGDCEFRLGQRWTLERLAAGREPHLRRNNVDVRRLRVFASGSGEMERIEEEVAGFRRRLEILKGREEKEAIHV